MPPTSNGHSQADHGQSDHTRDEHAHNDHARQSKKHSKQQPQASTAHDADRGQPLYRRVRHLPDQPTADDVNLLVTPAKPTRPIYEISHDNVVRAHTGLAADHDLARQPTTYQTPHPPTTRATDTTVRPQISLLAYVMCALIASLATAIFAYMLFAENEPPPIVLHSPLAPPPTETPAPTATPAPLVVFVSGAVRNVGVYQLQVDARVHDAIERAGGLLPTAAEAAVNRAQKLFDGAQVHIPYAEDEGAASAVPQVAAAPSIGLSSADGSGQENTATDTGGVVNLNTASQAAIESLPGIGASKAQEIIAGRPYGSVDELTSVSGIGPKTVETLRQLVAVE